MLNGFELGQAWPELYTELLTMRFGRADVGLARVSGEEGVVAFLEGEYGASCFRVSDDAALPLLAVHEGLAYVRVAERHAGAFDSDVVAAIGPEPRRLCQDVIGGIDAVAGYRRLIELFAPESWPADAGRLAITQLNDVAMFAMRKWTARRGRPPGPSIERDEIEALSGRELVAVDDELALRYGHGEVVFRLEGDLAVGRSRVIPHAHHFTADAAVLSRDALRWVAWAVGTEAACNLNALREPLHNVLTDSWSDPARHMRGAIDELARLAKGSDSERSAAARERLRARPHEKEIRP